MWHSRRSVTRENSCKKITLACQGEFCKCQLHTTDVGDVGWEPHGSSPTTCAGKADHEFGVHVPLPLICLLEIMNQALLLHKELEMPTLPSKFVEILKFVFFVPSCAQVVLRKIRWSYKQT